MDVKSASRSSPFLYGERKSHPRPQTPSFLGTSQRSPKGVLGARVKPDTCRIRVDVEIFECGKKEVADLKISGYLWTGPKYPLQFQLGDT